MNKKDKLLLQAANRLYREHLISYEEYNSIVFHIKNGTARRLR
jgi:hypothetical protein